MSGEDNKSKKSGAAVSKMRVAHIDNEEEIGHMELSEVNTEVITSKIGGLLKMLMEMDVDSEATDSISPASQWHNGNAFDDRDTTSSSIAEAWQKAEGGGGSSITLRATEVHSIVEERKRREAEKKAAAIVAREREMFLRAALQLLDQRESDLTSNELQEMQGTNRSRPHTNRKNDLNDTIRVGNLKKFSRGSFVKGTASFSHRWINKYIELRHGSFAYYEQDHSYVYQHLVGTNLNKTIKLTVDDCYCRPVKLSESDDSIHGKAKPASDVESANIDNCAFELSQKDGSRRLWLAANRQERDAWIRSINTAMIGSAGDFSLDATDGTGTIFVPQSPMADEKASAKNQLLTGGASTKNGSLSASFSSSSSVSSTSSNSAKQSGETRPVAGKSKRNSSHYDSPDMNLGLNLYLNSEKVDALPVKDLAATAVSVDTNGRPSGLSQLSLPGTIMKSASSQSLGEESSRSSIDTGKMNLNSDAKAGHTPMSQDGVNRTESDKNNNAPSSEGAAAPYAEDIAKFIAVRLAVNGITSADNYRKLMARMATETLSITVPVFYVRSSLGGVFQMAAQDMLSRQTVLNVNNSQVWKDLQRDSVIINGELLSGKDQGAEGMIGALVRSIVDKADAIRAILRISALNEASAQMRHGRGLAADAMEQSTFDLTEGQILACARDLLVLCGRTQSGGDTYFCVDNLLINRDNQLCFLAPSSADTPPLEFHVDIVESSGGHGRLRDKKSKHAAAIDAANKAHTTTSTPHAAAIAAANVQKSEVNVATAPVPASPTHATTGREVQRDSSNVDIGAKPRRLTPFASSSNASDATTNEESDFAKTGADSGISTEVDVSPSCGNQPTLTPPRVNLAGSRLPGHESKNSIRNVGGGSKRTKPGALPNFESAIGASRGASSGHTMAKERTLAQTHQHNMHIDLSLDDGDGSTDGSTKDSGGCQNNKISRGGRNNGTSLSIPPSGSVLGLTLSADGEGAAWEDASTVSDLTLETNHPGDKDEASGNARGNHSHMTGTNRKGAIVAGEGNVRNRGNQRHAAAGNKPSNEQRALMGTAKGSGLVGGHGNKGNSSGHLRSSSATTSKGTKSTSSRVSGHTQANKGTNVSKNTLYGGGSTSGKSMRNRLLQTIGDIDVPDLYVSTMCIRVTVCGVSKFRVCDMDPQDQDTATWATAKGTFKQVFFIKSNCNGRPAMSDRLVTIDVNNVPMGTGA